MLYHGTEFPFSKLKTCLMPHSFQLSSFPFSLLYFSTSFSGFLKLQAFKSLPHDLLLEAPELRSNNTTCPLLLKDLKIQQQNKLNCLTLYMSKNLFATWKLAKLIPECPFNKVLNLTHHQLSYFTTLLEQRLICKFCPVRDQIILSNGIDSAKGYILFLCKTLISSVYNPAILS